MARYAVLGLFVAATAAVGAAQAQPAPPAPPPPPPPAAAAPAPPAAEAPPPPVAPQAPPAPPAAPAAPAAAIGPYLIQAIDKICLPLIHGQKIKDVAQANGLRHYRDDWLLQGPGVERVIIAPPSIANPTVCQMTINYELDQTPGVVGVLGNWSGSQTPAMQVLAAASAVGPGVTGWTWESNDASGHQGLVFDHQTSADGKPLGRTFEVGTVLFSSGSN